MTGLAQIARQDLATVLTDAHGEDPTLCEGWDAHDLAAHIVIRERRPDAAAGILVPALADRAAAAMAEYREIPYDEVVELVRQGPRGWSPARVPAVDDAINLAEFYVHAEDVLRARPTWSVDEARPLRDDVEEALWGRLKQAGQLLFRRSPVGLVLDATDGQNGDRGTHSVHGPTKLGTVTVTGRPGELVLLAFGRGTHADIEYHGEPDAVEALRGARFSL